MKKFKTEKDIHLVLISVDELEMIYKLTENSSGPPEDERYREHITRISLFNETCRLLNKEKNKE